jgi:hypothetical protein
VYEYMNIVDLRSVGVASHALIYHCLRERICTVKCMPPSVDLRGVSEESMTSTENGTSLSVHGAQVASSGRYLGGWGQFDCCPVTELRLPGLSSALVGCILCRPLECTS